MVDVHAFFFTRSVVPTEPQDFYRLMRQHLPGACPATFHRHEDDCTRSATRTRPRWCASCNRLPITAIQSLPILPLAGAPFAEQVAGLRVSCRQRRDGNGRRGPGSGRVLSFQEAGMKRLTGVLLDVDGTPVDSNDAHAHA
jgi:hypothetical protein